jgi:bifunctional non-homologous end joining protein LigD
MRVLQRRDFVIGGYTPAGRNFDAILIGDYEGGALQYVAKVHGGFTPAVREAVFNRFPGLETKTCPFKNLPEARRGQWGEGLTAAEMEKCRWLKPDWPRRSIIWNGRPRITCDTRCSPG